VVSAIIFGEIMAHYYYAHLFYIGPFASVIGIICGALICFYQECWHRINRMWNL
jgi:hypothetical protein